MEKPDQRPWYKKKRYAIPLGTLGLLWVVGLAAPNSPQNAFPAPTSVTVQEVAQPVPSAATKAVSAQTTASQQPTQATSANVPLSNDNYYTNSAGNEVHSPAYAPDVPAGASARCGDGTYSFSQSRRGTCSHHGGVAEWL